MGTLSSEQGDTDGALASSAEGNIMQSVMKPVISSPKGTKRAKASAKKMTLVKAKLKAKDRKFRKASLKR